MLDTRPSIAASAVALLVLLPLVVACGERASDDATAGLAAPGSPPEPPSLPAVEELTKSVGAALGPVMEALKERDPLARAARLATLLLTLDPAAAAGVQDLLTDSAIDIGVVELSLLAEFWARHDARAAAHWALFSSPFSRRAGAIDAALTRLASEDPKIAAQELTAFLQVPGPFAEVAETALVRGWFASGKPGLTDYIRDLGVGFGRQRAVSAYSRALVQRDGAQAALDWAESIPDDDEEYQKDALRQTGWAAAMLDPLAAATWCDRVCPQRPSALSLRAMIAQRWGAIDGQAAMEWVSRAPADREQRWAVKGAFNGWWVEDRAGFETWLASVTRDGKVEPWLQPALEIYAASISSEDPLKALEWGGRIDDTNTRERTLMNVARFWRRSDQAAADAWLETSPLSEESREAVRNPQAAAMIREFPEEDAPGGG